MAALLAGSAPAVAATWSPAFPISDELQHENWTAFAVNSSRLMSFSFGAAPGRSVAERVFGAGRTTLGPGLPAAGESPVAAIDAHGDAVVAWTEGRVGASTRVWAATRRAGGDFGPPEQLDAPSCPDAGNPKVAMTTTGRVLVLFQTFRPDEARCSGPERMILAARTRAGTRFGSSQLVSSDHVDEGATDIACDSHARCVAAWSTLPPGRRPWGVDVAYSTPRGRFRPPRSLRGVRNPELTNLLVSASGRVVLVWQDLTGFNVPLTTGVAMGSTAGRLGPARVLARTRRAHFPDARIAPDGRSGVIAWDARRGHDHVLEAVLLQPGGISAPMTVARGRHVFRAHTTMVRGRPLLAWSGGETAAPRRVVMVRLPGTRRRTVLRVPRWIDQFRLTTDPRGRLVVVAVTDAEHGTRLIAKRPRARRTVLARTSFMHVLRAPGRLAVVYQRGRHWLGRTLGP